MDEPNLSPKPGTYGALKRSDEPMPWRKLLEVAKFSPEEFAKEGPAIVFRKNRALFEAVMEWDKTHR